MHNQNKGNEISARVNIKATKTTLTKAIEDFIYDKIDMLSEFIKEQDVINVELEVSTKHHSGPKYRAEIHFRPRGFYAESTGNDFYEAMDLLVPKIKEQLVKDKGKGLAKRRKARETVRRIKKGAV